MEHEKNRDQELEMAKSAAWKDGQISKRMELLNEVGAQNYFDKEFPDLKQAFVEKMDTSVCMDEGCAHKEIGKEGKLCIAGSGILLPAHSRGERLEVAARLFKELHITNITSHEGCGAAKLAYLRDNPGSNPTKEQVDKYAIDWAVDLAKEIEGARASNITLAEMERPAEFHTARVAYFDAVGGFNPNKESSLPMGFVVSRRHLPGEYALDELKVAISIAFGQHGFGNLFTSENPFVIIPLASNSEQLVEIEKEIAAALQDSPNRERIKVEGVVVEK